MNSDDDIPVLRDAVSRRARAALPREQLDELCDSLSAQVWVLLDRLMAEALQEAEENLRVRLNDRLNQELPGLIETAVRDKLAQSDD